MSDFGKIMRILLIVKKNPGLTISEIYNKSSFGAVRTKSFLYSLLKEQKVWKDKPHGHARWYDYELKTDSISDRHKGLKRMDRNWMPTQAGLAADPNSHQY